MTEFNYESRGLPATAELLVICLEAAIIQTHDLVHAAGNANH